MTIVVQINGKLRAQLELPSGTEKEAVLQAAKDNDKVRAHLSENEIKKSIYVPGKLVNLVI